MIRVYPSRHEINLYPCTEGQALESHVLPSACTIAAWMQRTIDGFELDRDVHPISVDVNGVTIEPWRWMDEQIQPDDDVRIYPVPFAAGAAFFAAYGSYIAIGIAVIGLAYALSLDTSAPDSNAIQGDKLDLSPAKANSAKLYGVIREIMGRDRVYPDYVVQPVSRFVSGRDVRTSLFLSVGVGRFSIPPSEIKIGGTPISAFGDEVSYAIYEPGAYVGNDARSENWYVAPEVGGSKAATAGLDLDSPSETTAPTADAIAIGGNTITLIGDAAQMPESWVEGTIINMVAPDTFTVTNSGPNSVIAGPLDELAPVVGMLVSLSTQTEDVDLVVDSFSPYVPPVPGTGGSPSSVTASAAPTTYDFSSAPIVWSLTYRGITRSLSLTADYVNMSGVVYELTSQLSGTGLVAQDDSGRLKILEPSSPYRGGVITQSSSPVVVFGVGPVFVTGSASTGGTPQQLANITLRYDDGTPFAGLPDGQQRLAIGYRQNRFEITDIDALTATVQRLDADGDVDAGWSGFTARTLLDFDLTSTEADGENWIGPFMACPEGELIDRLELDFFFPGGLQSTDKKGRQWPLRVNVILEYADTETGIWQPVDRTYEYNTRDGIGVTEGIDLPTPIRPMARVRRVPIDGYQVVSDTVQWYALRGRLQERPEQYDDVTTIALTIRTGSRLSAQSDRKINLVATRLYDEGENRSISAAMRHVHASLGEGEDGIDADTLGDLQSEYWSPRGETFDFTFDEQITALEAMQKILNAGMSHLVIEDSMISAFREGPQPIQGALTPHDQSAELTTSFTGPSADDYTGVDVKYKDPLTFTEEIVECRAPGVTAVKIEDYTLDGVQNRVRAWRIGMRRLMKYLYQRLTHQCDTEMDALAYRFGTRIAMTDDIPGNQTISCVIDAIEVNEESGMAAVLVSEMLDWSFPNPRCLIRWQDGSTTALLDPIRISDDQLMLAAQYIDSDVDWGAAAEPPRLIFCSSTKAGYSAMIESIEPDAEGRCQVVAKQYDPIFYSHDDAIPPA